MEYDKPYKTNEELISILKSRNVDFRNEELSMQDLSDFSYYYLINGYKSYFDKDEDTFKNHIDFDLIKMLSVLDTDLNNLILKYIIYIERSLCSKISATIAKNYGVETFLTDDLNNSQDYFCKNNYSSTPERNNTIKNIKQSLIENKDRNKSLRHYVRNHNHIPPWITINTLLFGTTIQLYKILKPIDKEYVCNNIVNTKQLNIDEKKEFLYKALIHLKEFRNSVAHGQKIILSSKDNLFNKTVINTLTHQKITKNEYTKKYGNILLFNVLISLAVLLRNDLKRYYLSEVSNFFSTYQNFTFNGKNIVEMLKLPYDISSILNTIE